VHSATEPQIAYDIDGQRWVKDEPGFVEAIVWAHQERLRPRCLCRPDADGQGIEMYVARCMDGYVVKRMPNTGSQHSTACPSYEPPADLTGLGQLLGTAIVEDPVTGDTNLKLDFSMSKLPGRSMLPTATTAKSSVTSQSQKLSLRALLHYLWDQAELTHWQPGFAGRRTWGTVRRHLLRAAENKITRGLPLLNSLYIPEVFSVEQRDAINMRRLRQWAHAMSTPGVPQQLMLMIAEVKEIVPARFGCNVVVKHVPDQAFAADEGLLRRLDRCFEDELALWSTEQRLHMLAIATFRMADSGIPSIVELSLLPVTAQWLPIEDQAENMLVEKLVRDERSFIKCLRYNEQTSKVTASAILTDCGTSPEVLVIARRANDREDLDWETNRLTAIEEPLPWTWKASNEVMPSFPSKFGNSVDISRLRIKQNNQHHPVKPRSLASG